MINFWRGYQWEPCNHCSLVDYIDTIEASLLMFSQSEGPSYSSQLDKEKKNDILATLKPNNLGLDYVIIIERDIKVISSSSHYFIMEPRLLHDMHYFLSHIHHKCNFLKWSMTLIWDCKMTSLTLFSTHLNFLNQTFSLYKDGT